MDQPLPSLQDHVLTPTSTARRTSGLSSRATEKRLRRKHLRNGPPINYTLKGAETFIIEEEVVGVKIISIVVKATRHPEVIRNNNNKTALKGLFPVRAMRHGAVGVKEVHFVEETEEGEGVRTLTLRITQTKGELYGWLYRTSN